MTMEHKPQVLLFSTGDATRSQMAQGFLRTMAGEKLAVVSTAVESTATDPMTGEVMKEVGVEIASQEVRPIAELFKEHFSFVITVCDASKERFPIWPFTQNIIHWNLIDPEKEAHSEDERKTRLRSVRDEIRRNVQEFLNIALPKVQMTT
jgi:arsenate reductase (thioredoxin)